MIDQIAVVTDDMEVELDRMREAGYDDWVEDTVTAVATIGERKEVEFRAHLAFSYTFLEGFEFELIQPLTRENYITSRGLKRGQLAHYGIHLDAADRHLQREELVDAFQLYATFQECWTSEHTNPSVPADRSYHYTIMASRLLPTPVKMIERLTLKK